MQVIQQVRTWLRGGRQPPSASAAATGLDSPAAAGAQGNVLGPAMGGQGSRLWPPEAGQGLSSGGRVRPRPAPVADHIAALVAALERDRPGDDCQAFRAHGVCARWRVLETYAAVAEKLQLVCLRDDELTGVLKLHLRKARLMALPATSMRPTRQTCYVLGEPAAKKTAVGSRQSAVGRERRGRGDTPTAHCRSADCRKLRIGPMYRPPAKLEAVHACAP